MSEPFLTYKFEGMKFEFGPKNEVFVTDTYFGRKYRLQINHDPELPFTIILEEKLHDWPDQISQK